MAIELFDPLIAETSADDYPTPNLGVRADLAFAARPLFVRLTETLCRVAALLDECRRMEARATRHTRAWGVPPLFFADSRAEREWSMNRPPKPKFPEPYLSLLKNALPKLYEAWDRLPDQLDDALALLAQSIDVRRMARAVPGLLAAASAVPAAGELAGILAMPEEVVLFVVHPAARSAYRLQVDGVADIAQLHILLADVLTGDPGRGLLPGTRPSFEVLEAMRDSRPTDGIVASSRFQFYRAEALRSDGTLPERFAGSAGWYWGREPLSEVPIVDGERVLVIGEPAVPMEWEVSRRFSRIAAKVELQEVLSKAAVERWLLERCPDDQPRERRISRAA